VTPAEVLAAAADKLDVLASKASPGPWFFNSYSYVGSAPKTPAYNDWEPGPDHTLERTGKCEPCGDWREAAACHSWPRGHGCQYFDQDYDMDPEVVSVRSHHGDTAVRSRAADAEYIAAMNPLVGKALVSMLRAWSGAYSRETRHFHEMWNEAQRERMIGDKFPGFTETLALARLIIGGES
jgi:hypothetical protein